MARSGKQKGRGLERRPLHVVVLAAGKGERMRSPIPKVLNTICGKPMLVRILEELRRLRPARIHVVLGRDQEQVRKAAMAPDTRFAVQRLQKGTADAARIGLEKVPSSANVLVVFGDLPLLTAAGLRRVVAAAAKGNLGLRTMEVGEPRGYSRVLRGEDGAVSGLVVEKAATSAQRRIREVDAGGMAFPAGWGKAALAKVRVNRDTGEYPLTELVSLAIYDGMEVSPVEVSPEEGLGVNTESELLFAGSVLSARLVDKLKDRGVLFADPGCVLIRGEASVSPGSFIDRNVILEGKVKISSGCSVGPNCIVRNSTLAADSRVDAFSHVDGARLGRGAQAGPFARLRPGTILGAGAKVGNFVETKKSKLGAGSKANHLAYLGDGVVGVGVNIGAGTVFCNYDGKSKHRTEVGDGSFIGSGSMLVAPVVIGKGALVAAGSVITRSVKDGEMAIGRSRQKNVGRRKSKRGR